jgi:PAS domain S-box-containing protein
MARAAIKPTGIESPYGEEEIIVSKTNLKGHITYANDVFARVSGYRLTELIGQPHSVIRHPEMPRCVFKLAWDTIQAKKEIFAYVVNLARDGRHYWVFAHLTPNLDAAGNVIGYHSNRRRPNPDQVAKVKDLYAGLLAEEKRHDSRKDGMLRGYDMLLSTLKDKGVSYDEFVFAL